MPELPEVETMVRDLTPRVVNHTIITVQADFPGAVIWPTFEEFEQRVLNQKILDIRRRGKYAIFSLHSGDNLIIHRGMTGALLLRPPDAPMESHVRLMFQLDDNSQLRFNDPRKFGKVLLMDSSGMERPLPWARMGPEPLNGDFTPRTLKRSLEGRTGPIKPLLLNQNLVAGLGNIYVDEALFAARIHPRRTADSLKPSEIKRLHASIQRVLHAAVEGRGTTFSSYTDVDGKPGLYKESLQVFQRAEEPCPRCGTTITRLVVGGRGTHICPKCQKL
jgi:formamidopyrimidine-DNA glycosylase